MPNQDSILFWLENDILALAISVMLAAFIIPNIILIAFRKQLFDEIDTRKIHKGAVPRLGGISFFPSYLFSVLVVVAMNLRFGSTLMQTEVMANSMEIYFEFAAIILLFLVGIADDLVGVRYIAKFGVQIVASVLIICSGSYINDFHGIFWLHELPDPIAWIFTAFAVVFVVNAINLIDGIDGLASGLSMIALGFYAVVFFNGGQYLYSMIAAAVTGTLFPFFYYNVFGNAEKHSKIFMGDTGALTTGVVIAFCAIAVMCAKPDFLTDDYNPAIVAISPLIVPCFDVCRVYFHRVKRGVNPFLPDKAHIHHKLLALGMNQANALLSILAVSLAFTGANVLLSPYLNPTIILLGDIAVWTGANMMLTRAIRRRENRLGHDLYK